MLDKKILRKMIFPAIILVILVALPFIFVRFTPSIYELLKLDNQISQLHSLVPKLFVITLLYFVFRIIVLLMEFFIQRVSFLRKKSLTTFLKTGKFMWWALYVIIVLSILLGNIGSIITSIGLVGLGLTFALQKPILNFVGWLTITFKNIYSEGDRVKIGNIRGDVSEVQLMNTVLHGLMPDSDARSYKIITLPNELVLTQDVENYTKDSNYIRDELKIAITYESDYHKAQKLLSSIVISHINKNINSFKKEKQESKFKLEKLIQNLKYKTDSDEKKKLEEKRGQLQKEINALTNLEEDFKPRMKIELADSSVVLIAQFLTPYDQLSKNRTEINLAFLDAIAKEKNINVAYPHLELVAQKSGK